MTAYLRSTSLALAAALATAAPATAQQAATSAEAQFDKVLPQKAVQGAAAANGSVPVVQPIVQNARPALVQHWPVADAQALLKAIQGIGAEGLDPRDYRAEALRQAIALGPSEELDQLASETFGWLVEDLRDGRTPMEARKQWFVVDPDPDLIPTGAVLSDALARHDIAGALAGLNPTHPDYLALKTELAATKDAARRKVIRANMDRWRWLARDLGNQYLITNVPEYQLRLTVNDKIIRTYRTIVGKPGRSATPQLAETVEGVVFNPTWTVPQSIVKGEGLGAKVLGNPTWARNAGYKATKGANGYVSVVQQPGPGNSLGQMKLDMPNPHAIFLHDTPSRDLFNRESRALSHGCVRTERALELAMTVAILGQGASKDEAIEISRSGKYTRVPVVKTMPVYITYFTMGRDIEGNLRAFSDIYDRDAPVLASFDAPRVGNRARATSEEAVEIVDDLQDS